MASGAEVPKSIELILPEKTPKPLMSYSPCIRAGDWVFVAGQLATDFVSEDGVAPGILAPNRNTHDQLEKETEFISKNLQLTVEAAGCDMSRDVVRIWDWFVGDEPTMEQFAAGDNYPNRSVSSCYEVQDKRFADGIFPAEAGIGVRRLLIGHSILEIDLIAFHPDDGQKTEVLTNPSPGRGRPGNRPLGTRRGDWIFLSGLTAASYNDDGSVSWPSGADPSRHSWWENHVEAQTEAALDNIEVALEANGSTLSQVVKADVYIGNPQHFASIERVWRRRFPNDPPAKTVVPYSGLGTGSALVEIAVTALSSDSSLTRSAIETSDAPEPLGYEPQAMRAGSYLFYSQQMAFDSSGALAEGMERRRGYPFYGQPPKNQVDYLMSNVGAIATAAGSSVDNLCKRQVFHDDAQWFAETWAEWGSKFVDPQPCSTTIEIGAPLVVPGAHVLFDLIGYIPS